MIHKKILPNKILRKILLLIFLLSGMSALIYQIIWARMFSFVFGVTTFAISTVLSAFMAGLSLGSLYFGKRVDKHENPLRLFAKLEIFIGMYAIAFPFILSQLNNVYVFIYQSTHPNIYLYNIIRFFLAFPVLLIPTGLMGGTLPVLCKYFIKKIKTLGWNVGNLYSINNLGAVIGCLVAGFLFIKMLGVHGTLYLAALMNLLIGIFSFKLSQNTDAKKANDKSTVKIDETIKGSELNYSRFIITFILWAFAIEGFSSLGYEVIWTRMLVFFMGSTTYAFTTMLASFICGLTLGSFLIATFIDRRKNYLSLLGVIEIIIGIYVLFLWLFWGILSQLAINTADPFAMSSQAITSRFLICFIIMLVPTTLMGTTFPLVSKIYTSNIKRVGHSIGTLGFLDTVGSIFGAFAVGFFFIPLFGIKWSLLSLGMLNVVIGASIIIIHPVLRMKIKRSIVFAVTGILGIAIIANSFSKIHFRMLVGGEEINEVHFYREGASATTMVFEAREEKEIAIDGYPVAGTSNQDFEVQKTLAHFPLLLHNDPQNICIVGFGAGGTSWSASQHNINEIDCAELVPDVIKAAKYFPEVNHGVLDDPRYKVILEDGRNFLLTTEKTYDVITVDATSPKLAGNGNLYSIEFYKLCQKKLSKDGIMCQWLPYHLLTMREIKMIVRTFYEVFPYSTIWFTPYRVYYLLIGTQKKLEIDFGLIKTRMQAEKVKMDLEEVRIHNPFALISCFALDENAVWNQVKNSKINSDNRPFLEFFASDEIDLPASLFPKNAGRPIIRNIDLSDQKQLVQYFNASDHFLQVRLFNLSKKDKLAYEECKKILNIIPNDEIAKHISKECRIQLAYRYLVEGMHYHDAQNYNLTIQRYEDALALTSEWPEVLLRLGIAYNEVGRYDEAITTLKKAIENDSTSSSAYSNLAVAYINNLMDDKAKNVLEKAIIINPDYPPYYFHMAFLYNENKEYDKAISQLKKAISLDSNYPEAHYRLGLLFLTVGKTHEGKLELQKALKIKPDFKPAIEALKTLK